MGTKRKDGGVSRLCITLPKEFEVLLKEQFPHEALGTVVARGFMLAVEAGLMCPYSKLVKIRERVEAGEFIRSDNGDMSGEELVELLRAGATIQTVDSEETEIEDFGDE